MAIQKPSLPEGVRDFGPDVVRRRQYIFDIIRSVFRRFGYQPLETPTLEKLSTLTGKYGDEGDKLLFKVLNNGDFLAKANQEALESRNSNKLISSIADRGLRYDLTVPFARYVVMNQGKMPIPFKRYQIQPVWRADRPQKGRYREFTQCDADVVGSPALHYEAELMQIYDQAFSQLNLPVTILINHRKVLEGFAEAAGCLDQFINMTVAIDKLDKIGIGGVKDEMVQRGISQASIEVLTQLLQAKSIAELKPLLAKSEAGTKGIEELETVFEYLDNQPLKNTLQFDPTLARGLSYYTGCIFEVKANNVSMGSIGGGGRYADLTGVFGLPNLSGVGISFGADRIYDVLLELDAFPADLQSDLDILFLAFDALTHRYAFDQLGLFRQAGLSADLYPEPTKMQKQMKYANERNARYVAIIGSDEMESNVLTIKNLHSGEQQKLSANDAIAQLLADARKL